MTYFVAHFDVLKKYMMILQMSCFVNQINDLQTIGKEYSCTFCLPWALLIYPLSDSMGLSMSCWQLSISDSQPSGWHSWEDLVHLYQTADNYGSLETNKLIFWRISCHKNSPIFYQIFHYFFSYLGFPCLQHTYLSSSFCEDSRYKIFFWQKC